MSAEWNGTVHSAADIFPMIEAVSLAELADDIKRNGLANPGWLMPDGALLDGRNRANACVMAGVPMQWQTYAGDDPIAFVLSLNMHRRHLTDGQLAMVATRIEPMYAEQALEAKRAAGGNKFTDQPKPLVADRPQAVWADRAPLARDRAANAVGVSGRAVARAKRITKHAPDLAEKVTSGELALDAAERQLKRREVQKSESDARQITVATTPADAQGESWRMLRGDFRERLNELADGSVDLIITDPPYPADFIHLLSDLSKVAARVLKPQGVLVAMTGKIQLPESMRRLGEHLQYGWMYVQPLPGSGSRILARQVIQQWKPWIAYSNGAWPSSRIDWHPDMLDPSFRAKDRYRWEQDPDPAKMLIHELSDEGGLVVDPFTGSGSFGVAALAMGRRFIGVEMDADRFDQAAERING